MTKTEYEKIYKLLQLKERFTDLLEMLQTNKNDMTLQDFEFEMNTQYYQYWLDKDTNNYLCRYLKKKLTSIHNELKEIGYYDY